MQIIRYLNGVPLSGAMPPLVLPFSLPRQHVPLPPRARSAILKAGGTQSRKGKTMKHTALYLRVSTEAQADEGYSLAAQAEKLEAYCRMKGIDRFTQYVDGGFSGSNLSRPAVTQLIDCIRRGEVERVVVYKLDRLSRSQKDTLYLSRTFRAARRGFRLDQPKTSTPARPTAAP